MKKFLAVALLSLGLAGCAQQIQDVETAFGVVTGASITPQQAYIAANAFYAVEATATQYLKLPVCGSVPCRNASATAVIVPAVRAGRLAVKRVLAAVNANPTGPVNANLLSTLTSSTSTLKAILTEYGVK